MRRRSFGGKKNWHSDSVCSMHARGGEARGEEKKPCLLVCMAMASRAESTHKVGCSPN